MRSPLTAKQWRDLGAAAAQVPCPGEMGIDTPAGPARVSCSNMEGVRVSLQGKVYTASGRNPLPDGFFLGWRAKP